LRLEMPLLILEIWLHPSDMDVARTIVNSGGVDIMTLIDLIDGYAEQWGFKDSAVSASLAVRDWSMNREPWVKSSGSFGKQADKDWGIFLSSSSASPRSDNVRSRQLLSKVARKLLTVMPNAADPERVFFELGRMIMSSHTRLDDAQSTRMLFIAADFRAQRRQG
jgi:hypothetical protein